MADAAQAITNGDSLCSTCAFIDESI